MLHASQNGTNRTKLDYMDSPIVIKLIPHFRALGVRVAIEGLQSSSCYVCHERSIIKPSAESGFAGYGCRWAKCQGGQEGNRRLEYSIRRTHHYRYPPKIQKLWSMREGGWFFPEGPRAEQSVWRWKLEYLWIASNLCHVATCIVRRYDFDTLAFLLPRVSSQHK